MNRRWAGRAAAGLVLAGLITHGALLRLDAIAARYGVVSSPRWLVAAQTRTIAAPQAIRPASISWEREGVYPHRDGSSSHYYSDPQTYLEAGRSMRWFYAAHPREPVFPFATKAFLGVLGGQDVAVSFASAFFSTVTIGLTYLLGAALWSRPAGLLAAAGVALDFDVITLASKGWRDDAYMAALALCAYLTVRWWQAGRGPARVVRVGRWNIDAIHLHALGVGVAGGFAILTRITAVSFVAAGLAAVMLAWGAPWRRSIATTALAAVAALLVAAPYYVNCWRVLGDPFYTFNVHASVYSLAEGHAEFKGSTAGYISRKFADRPVTMIDTVARGLTTYPFLNKWTGLNPWVPGIGWWAAAAALAGLVILAAWTEGRLVLFMTVVSLVPFAFTWTVDPDYRFTELAFPIFLIAAAVAMCAPARMLPLIRQRRHGGGPAARRRPDWMPWTVTVGLGAVALWCVLRVLPSRAFAEALQSGEDATLAAGDRDATSFTSGWSDLIRGDNVNMRVTTGTGVVSIRLPEIRDYTATVRMDPVPRPADAAIGRLPDVAVMLNDQPIASLSLEWAPDRVGAYLIALPRAAVRRGTNRLTLQVAQDGGIGVWYVRVHGAAPGVTKSEGRRPAPD